MSDGLHTYYRGTYHIILPANGVQCHRNRGSVGDGIGEEAGIRNGRTLTAEVRRPDLRRVHVGRTLNRRRKPGAKEEIHCHGAVVSWLVPGVEVVPLQGSHRANNNDRAKTTDHWGMSVFPHSK